MVQEDGSKRMTISLLPDLADGLEFWAKKLGISEVDFIRLCIKRDVKMSQELKEGGRLFIDNDEGEREIILIR